MESCIGRLFCGMKPELWKEVIWIIFLIIFQRDISKELSWWWDAYERPKYIILFRNIKYLFKYYVCLECILTLVLLNPICPAFANSVDPDQLASANQLIWICTVCHSVWESISTWIKLSDWLTIRSRCGILIYSAWQGQGSGKPEK